MSLSLTEFRANLYKIVEIEFNGVKIRVVPEKVKSKLKRLTKHPGTIKGDSDSLVHVDWPSEWENKNL